MGWKISRPSYYTEKSFGKIAVVLKLFLVAKSLALPKRVCRLIAAIIAHLDSLIKLLELRRFS
jgi:hypothetical protein